MLQRSGFLKRFLRWARTSYFVRGLLVFSCLLAVAYQVEDWRGKRAWEIRKQRAERKGMVLDWQKLVPPPVAEELNAFKAPMSQPGEALREIRLIHDLCGLLENKPSGKPVTLVAAMIRVALTGLSATTVAEGFPTLNTARRMKVWLWSSTARKQD